MTSVNLIGCGGHSRSVLDLLINQNFQVMNYFDDNGSSDESILDLVEYGGKVLDVPHNIPVVLAIGNNEKRKEYFEKLNVYNYPIIHSTSRIGNKVKIHNSSLIFSNTNICAGVSIGANCIINTNALIEHESLIGNHSHISIGVVIAGRVKVGDNCFLGAGSIIKDQVSIVSNVIIGAGAVVLKDIKSPGIYAGVPARKIKEN